MKIDYKGYQYAVVTIQGGVLYRANDYSDAYVKWRNSNDAEAIKTNPDYKEESKVEDETNPEYKEENEMIYTKQSYDVGETPIKGDFVGILQDKAKSIIYGQIIADTKSFLILLDVDSEEWLFNKNDFEYKPYLTDKEKAIDDLSIVIENYNKSPVGLKSEFNLAEWLFNDINDSQIHGVTFTGDK